MKLYTLFLTGTFLVQSVLASRPPVILVNGLGGAQLTATLNVPSGAAPHSYCKTTGTESLWVNPKYFLPGLLDCYNFYLTLTRDEVSGIFSDPPGVAIDTVDFGGVNGIPYLDSVIKKLSSSLGYVVGKDLHGAPYDWRLSSEGLDQRGYFKKVQKLVEDTFSSNGDIRVVIITHSMGGPVTLEFLTRMSQDWKNKYIEKYIALVPPYGGAMSSLRAAISGGNFGIPVTSEQAFFPMERKEGSLPYLFPLVASSLWGKDEVVVETPSRKYTVSDLEELYNDLGDKEAEEIFDASKNLTLTAFHAPNVDTYVLYGSGFSTDAKLSYKADFQKGVTPPIPTVAISEDGDGTVAVRSAIRGNIWNSEHGQNGFKLEYTECKGASHGGILQDTNAINKILSLLSPAAENDPVPVVAQA